MFPTYVAVPSSLLPICLTGTAKWRCPRPDLDQHWTIEPRTFAPRPMNGRDLDPDLTPGIPCLWLRCSAHNAALMRNR
jgi:hypothetical protein